MIRIFTKRAIWAAAFAAQHSAAHADDAASVAGTYCLSGVMEVGSCLRLTVDGKFEYFLAYGAYDEKSEGQWRLEGGDVVLDSLRYDKAPKFTFKAVRHADGDHYDIIVENKNGHGITGIDVRATCDGRAVEVGTTGAGGYNVDCKSAPKDVSLGLEMFGLAYQVIDVSAHAGAGKAYVFEFDPGDLGSKVFAGTHLKTEGRDSLVMTYANSPIRELEGHSFKYRRE